VLTSNLHNCTSLLSFAISKNCASERIIESMRAKRDRATSEQVHKCSSDKWKQEYKTKEYESLITQSCRLRVSVIDASFRDDYRGYY